MTADQLKKALGWLATTLILAAIWYVLVAANTALFERFEFNPTASLIYLPAALRIIYPLVFRSAGVGGIILGSYLSMPHGAADGTFDAVILAILSGLAPLVGISVFKMIYKTRPDLGDLRPAHLIALAVLCAASNTIVLNLFLAVDGNLIEPLIQIATVFIGDVIGTIIVLYLTSFILTFFMSRTRA